MLNWLNTNSGAVNAIGGFVLTAVTAVYVFLTARLVRESAATRAALERPDVSVTVAPHEAWINFLMLTIANQGGGPAFDVRFSIEWGYEARRRDLREVGLFKTGLSRLASGQRIEMFLDDMPGKFEELKKHPLVICASYKDAAGRELQGEFKIDFASFENLPRIGELPLYQLADEVQSLRKLLDRLSSGGRLKVSAYSLEDEAKNQRSDRLWLAMARLTPDQHEQVAHFIKNLSPPSDEGAA